MWCERLRLWGGTDVGNRDHDPITPDAVPQLLDVSRRMSMGVHQRLLDEAINADVQMSAARIDVELALDGYAIACQIGVAANCKQDRFIEGNVVELGQHETGGDVSDIIQNVGHELQELSDALDGDGHGVIARRGRPHVA